MIHFFFEETRSRSRFCVYNYRDNEILGKSCYGSQVLSNHDEQCHVVVDPRFPVIARAIIYTGVRSNNGRLHFCMMAKRKPKADSTEVDTIEWIMGLWNLQHRDPAELQRRDPVNRDYLEIEICHCSSSQYLVDSGRHLSEDQGL